MSIRVGEDVLPESVNVTITLAAVGTKILLASIVS